MSQMLRGWDLLALTLGGLSLLCMHLQLQAHPIEAHSPRICMPPYSSLCQLWPACGFRRCQAPDAAFYH